MVALFSRPLAAIDEVWGQVYRKVGIRALMASGRGTSIFDKKGIDTVVDGAAYSVRGVGRISSRIQTGRLQDYLAWMVVGALMVFAVVWWYSI